MTVRDRVTRLIDEGAEVAVRAPGRANLIGEHTDYNDGFVLPIAIDLATYVIGTRASDLSLRSEADPELVTASADRLSLPPTGWGRYVVGVLRALRDDGISIAGLHGTVVSDVPIGAGLASSAALEVALALSIGGEALSPPRLAEVCRRAENDFVGVRSGIMDQLTSAAARGGHACLIDCCHNSIEYVAFPDALRVVIADSGIRRDLADSVYNLRVEECERAAAALGVASLRDVSAADLDAASNLDPVLRRRARHVITENERVLATVEALRSGDRPALGEIFAESHHSYSADYEASTPEIDDMVARARSTDGVIAARLTGGGWGGCTVNVIESDADAAVVAEKIGGTGWWVTEAADGAGSVG